MKSICKVTGLVLLLAAIISIFESPGLSVLFALVGVAMLYIGGIWGQKGHSPIVHKHNGYKPKKESEFLEVVGSIASIPSIDMFGLYSNSKNEEYTLVWSDSDRTSGTGGHRMSGHGSYVLVHKNSVLASGKRERPNDGKVANNGAFVLSDWRFGSGLKSRIHCFSSNGNELYRREFKANMYNVGIDDSGKFVVAQLCNSESEDAGRLIFIDLTINKILWKISPVTGWADSYVFDNSEQQIGLEYKNRGTYFYSYSGDFLDAQKWNKDRLDHGSGYELISLCKEKFESLEVESSKGKVVELTGIIHKAIEKDDVKNDGSFKAKALRLEGEIHEKTGDYISAIEAYEKALLFNPKVGVKRRLNNLQNFINDDS